MDFDADRRRLEGVLAALGCPHPDTAAYVVTFGQPKPQARARSGKGGRHYKPAADQVAETATALTMRRVLRRPLAGNLAVACLFYRADRRRVDGDNLLKHVLDAGNGVAWADDSLITAQAGLVELDRDSPRTVIAVAPHVSTLLRGAAA